jgi:hypothetical protein
MATAALASAPVTATQAMPTMGGMPDGMVMAPGEHCMYCPPTDASAPAEHSPDLCAFPHDPQVDSRAAFASTMLAPPPVVVLLLPYEIERLGDAFGPVAAAPPLAHAPLAVSFCRFLK